MSKKIENKPVLISPDSLPSGWEQLITKSGGQNNAYFSKDYSRDLSGAINIFWYDSEDDGSPLRRLDYGKRLPAPAVPNGFVLVCNSSTIVRYKFPEGIGLEEMFTYVESEAQDTLDAIASWNCDTRFFMKDILDDPEFCIVVELGRKFEVAVVKNKKLLSPKELVDGIGFMYDIKSFFGSLCIGITEMDRDDKIPLQDVLPQAEKIGYQLVETYIADFNNWTKK
jgi:hypothetical protein